MNSRKTFVLMQGHEKGYGSWVIQTVIYRNGAFNSKGAIRQVTNKDSNKYVKVWIERNKEKHKKYQRMVWKKHYVKNKDNYTKQRLKREGKGFGFHKISLPLAIPFDWHHVNKNDVVAISRDIHNAVYHKCKDGRLEGVVG